MRRDLLILFFILLSSALMADERTNEAPSFKVQGIVTDEKGPGQMLKGSFLLSCHRRISVCYG